MIIKQKHLDNWYKQALVVSEQSNDEQTKVGSLLIKKETRSIISSGFNGFVRGADDVYLPKTRPDKYEFMIHSEMNLLYNCLLNNINIQDCFVFCTLSPCSSCIRALVQCGINTVYFKDEYRDFKNNLNMKDVEVMVHDLYDYKELTIFSRKRI